MLLSEEGLTHLEWLRTNYLDQPHEVSLETYTQCNAACSFCPYPTLERIGNRMPESLIYRLIDEMADWKPFLFSPFKVSEPLLDKRLFTILERVNTNKNANIRIFTNGSALNWDNMEKLSWVDNLELWISVNSHQKAVYEPLMGLSFDRLMKNLDLLHGSDFPHPVKVLQVGPVPQFKDYCENRWPRFDCVLVKKDAWLGYTEADNLEIPDSPCARWFELSIMSNGICAMCCMDSVGKYAIGDVTNQSMLAVYNSYNWRQRREDMISRKEIYPCSTCSY